MEFFSFWISSKGLGIIVSLLVSFWVARMILKKYKPQTVLLLGGIALFAFVIIISWIWGEPTKIIGNQYLPADHTLNTVRTLHNPFLDIFASMERLFSNRVAGLGMLIMAVMGFVKYMDAIGANKTLVRIGVKPLRFIKSPYVVLVFAFLLGLTMKMAITSAAGLGVLLMATMFPIMLQLGVSRAAATAVIATTGCIDLGPAAGINVAIVEAAGILTSDGKADVALYFIKYQLPVAIPAIAVMTVLHFIVQRWFDKKESFVPQSVQVAEVIVNNDNDEEKMPSYYAIFPMLPLLFVLTMNEMVILEINKALASLGSSFQFVPRTIGLVAAILISLLITMTIEYIRSFNARKVFDSIQTVFDGMGVAFATVVTLIVAGEVFAAGLLSSGSINTMLDFAKDSGTGIVPIAVFLQGLMTTATFLMGSGDAAIFSFMSVGAVVAGHFNVEPIALLMPMQICSSIARSFSPITAVVVAVSSIAGLSPVDVVKRTAIPMIGGLITLTIVNIILFL
jgi:DcuC family C4-dicarboxylate transporter